MEIGSLTDKKLVRLIKDGAVGIIPTDTIYGIVTSVENSDSIARLYKLKGRVDKPGTVIAANIDQLERLGIKRRYLKAVEEFWPGPVSIVIPCSNILNDLDMGNASLAVRLPDNNDLIDLLIQTGPLMTTSANKSGKEAIGNLDQAKTIFKDTLDFYVDGGSYSGHTASAVIKIVDDAVEVIRAGHNFNK